MRIRITNYLLLITVFFLAFGWLVLLFSAIGLFYRETIILSIIVSFVFSLYISQKKKLEGIKDFGKTSIFVFLIAFAASFTTCYFATPTVFGGRDQGAISTAAIYLSKNHSLKIQNPAAQELFQKYGSGKALNYPGFDYTKDGKLISRFPVGYTSYLASAYNLFGLKGIQYANFTPLALFLILFWLTLREFFSEKISFLGFLLAATFFPFLWFAKYTLTETYALFLVWMGIYFLLAYYRSCRGLTSTNLYLYISLAAFGLSAFVRIEGIVFFLLAVIYILALQKKNIIQAPKNFKKYLLISTLFLIIIYVFLNFPALFDSAKNIVKAFLPDSAKESSPSANLYSHLARIFLSYNILAYLILGLAGILWLAKNIRQNWLKPEFIPIFLTFPTFLYLIFPMITLDDPWMLRRFAFAVFPALIFYSVYFLNRFFYHKIFLYISLVVLAAANIVVSSRFLTLSENKELLPQIEKISQKFRPNDLILVDRMATGSGFSLASEPMNTLYRKNAVYFFNADDLAYINQNQYENIYLVAPLMSEEKPWYADLIKDKSFEIEIIRNNFLEPSEKKWALAENVELKTFAGIWKIK